LKEFDMNTPRVVIHQDEDGNISVVADDGVAVFWVDDRASDDRIYQMDARPIPEGLLNGSAGHSKDGSRAATRLNAAVAHLEGRSHLSLVEPDPLSDILE
jgi:hypothetical protein